MLMGTSFVVSAFLQVVRGYNAIQTGLIFIAETWLPGVITCRPAPRVAIQQRTHILAGFMMTIAGLGFLLGIVKHSPSPWAFAPGLLLICLGLRVMLTPSVNVVQSEFPEERQGEISGPSLGVSNRAQPSALRSPTRSSSRGSPRLPAPTPSP